MAVRSAAWALVGAALLGSAGFVGSARPVIGAVGPVSDATSRMDGPAAVQDTPVVVMETSMGTIVLELYPWKAPITVENFLRYVEPGFYNGLIFHRVMPGFVIQAGAFTRSMRKRSTLPAIENESDNGLNNKRGTIAMARESNPNSARSQFYINLSDNSQLNFKGPQRGWGYTVFGRVRDGMDVADAISQVETGVVGGMPDVPLEQVVIVRATLVKDEASEGPSAEED